MSLADMELAVLMKSWERFAAERQGFSYDGASQETAALLAEGERQLEAWSRRDAMLKRRSQQSAR